MALASHKVALASHRSSDIAGRPAWLPTDELSSAQADEHLRAVQKEANLQHSYHLHQRLAVKLYHMSTATAAMHRRPIRRLDDAP